MTAPRVTATIAAALDQRERHVVDYLRVFLAINDQLPPSKTIAQAFGWKSANAAYEVLQALERKGHLERNEIGNLMLARRSIGPQEGAL